MNAGRREPSGKTDLSWFNPQGLTTTHFWDFQL